MAEKIDKDKKKQIVTIHPLTKQSYKLKNGELASYNIDKDCSKKDFYASYIYAKDVISGTIEINRRVEDDDLEDAIELEAYEALGLDIASEYKIIHFEALEASSNDRVFNVFAINANHVRESFKEITNKTKYIDYLTITPFLVKSLYQRNILEPIGTECFIYFQNEDAFLTIYKNGEYLYSKSLNYSITQINEKFCEMVGERVDENEFIRFLTTEGLNSENQKYQQYLMQLFSEIFLYLNDVTVFFKRSFNDEEINRIYIGTEFGNIEGLKEYSQSYLGAETLDFEFNFAKNKKDWKIDQIHVLLMLASQVCLEDSTTETNLTLFQRPPPFSQRASGKLLIAMVSGIILSLLYPTYNYIYGYMLKAQSLKKESEYREVHVKAEALRNTIAKLDRKKKEALAIYKKEDDKLQFRKKLLNEIYAKKVKYPMKAMMFYDLIKMINNKSINIKKIAVHGSKATASLVSSSDKQLTELLKEISATKTYSVTTKKIIQEEKEIYYTSDVITDLKNNRQER